MQMVQSFQDSGSECKFIGNGGLGGDSRPTVVAKRKQSATRLGLCATGITESELTLQIKRSSVELFGLISDFYTAESLIYGP